MKIFKTSMLCCFAFILFFTSAACKGKKQPQAVAMPVNAVKVIKTDLPFEMQYPAQLAGSLEVQIRAQASGILKARMYEEGSYVQEGTQLFQIDDEPYKIALAKATGALHQAQSDVTRTHNDYKRMSSLYKKGSVSRKEYDDASAAYESAKANAEVAKAEVDNAAVNLSDTKVAAPISGLTGISLQSIGSLISAGSDSGLLTTMVQTDPIYVNFNMPSSQFAVLAKDFAQGKVATNEENTLPVQAQVILQDGSAYPQTAKIIFFDSSENPQTASIFVRAALPNPQNQRLLIPGQFVRVNLLGVNYKDEIVIPESAVLKTPAGDISYVVNQDNVLEARTVTGEAKGGIYMISSGLKEGETAVLDGLIKVRAGEKVAPVMKEFAVRKKETAAQADTVNIPGNINSAHEAEIVILDAQPSEGLPLVSGSSLESVDSVEVSSPSL